MSTTPIYDATVTALAGRMARQSVRAAFRHVRPHCTCGRFLTKAGECRSCDQAGAA